MPDSSERSDKRPRVATWRVGLVAGFLGVWFLSLSAVLTWPVLRAPGATALGHPAADGLKHLWTLWWMRASVWQAGSFPFHTDLVNFPVGMDLYPIEPLNGLAAVLLPGVDIVALANLLAVANVALTGIAGAIFGFVLSRRWVGAFVTGTLLEGSAVMAFFVHVGVGELQHLWWLPLGFSVLIMARRSGRWPWFLLLALVLSAAVLSGFYLGLFLGLGTALWALLTLPRSRAAPKLLLRYGAAAGLALALVLPITRIFSTSYQTGSQPTGGALSWIIDDQGQPTVDSPSARLDPAQVLAAQAPPATQADAAYGGGRYLGWLSLGLALLGLLRRPRQALPWVAVAALGYVLALGSYLTSAGELFLRADGAAYRLPMLYLNRALALVAEPINFPVRFLALTTVALSASAALAVRRWGVLLAVLAIVEVGVQQRVDWPWARSSLAPMPELQLLARDYPGVGVVDLDLMLRPDLTVRRSSIAAQVRLEHPINLMPIERIEFFAQDGRWLVEALPVYDALGRASRGETVTLSAAEGAVTRALLRDAGLRLVLVHHANQGRVQVEAALDQLFGQPVAKGQAATLWAVAELAPGEAVDSVMLAKARAKAERLGKKGTTLGRALR